MIQRLVSVGLLAIGVNVLTPSFAFADEPAAAAAPAPQPAAPQAQVAPVTAAQPPAAAPPPAPAPAPAHAETARPWLAQSPPPPVAQAPAASKTPWRALAALLVVGGIGAGAMYIRRRKLLGPSAVNRPRIRVLDTTRIGPKSYLVLTQIGTRSLLLGVTNSSVRRIAWLKTEDTVAPELVKQIEEEERESAFGSMLKGKMQSSRRPVAAPEPEEDREQEQSPAIILARSTRDLVETSKALAPARGTARAASVEGQVSGLSRRRHRS